jgi:hypothetical protein
VNERYPGDELTEALLANLTGDVNMLKAPMVFVDIGSLAMYCEDYAILGSSWTAVGSRCSSMRSS